MESDEIRPDIGQTWINVRQYAVVCRHGYEPSLFIRINSVSETFDLTQLMTHNGYIRIDSNHLMTQNRLLKFDSNQLTTQQAS